jgi:hypothetical protein
MNSTKNQTKRKQSGEKRWLFEESSNYGYCSGVLATVQYDGI